MYQSGLAAEQKVDLPSSGPYTWELLGAGGIQIRARQPSAQLSAQGYSLAPQTIVSESWVPELSSDLWVIPGEREERNRFCVDIVLTD